MRTRRSRRSDRFKTGGVRCVHDLLREMETVGIYDYCHLDLTAFCWSLALWHWKQCGISVWLGFAGFCSHFYSEGISIE